MFDLDKITRSNIRSLAPYTSARDEYSGQEGTFLDANENPFGVLNRYPDPYQVELKKKIQALKGGQLEQLFIGNGSDEIIDLLFRIFCNPGKDKALTFSPTYGMYSVSAAINDVELIKSELDADFNINYAAIEPLLTDPNLKMILICSPNNPTGNCFDKETIQRILNIFDGLVVVDEAYIDFSDTASCVELLSINPNLVVSQTMSKAWGLAAARIGFAHASEAIITLLNKVKPPYNVSKLNQEAAIEALNNIDTYKEIRRIILKEKQRLFDALNDLTIVRKVYPSEANFFLVEMDDADQVYAILVAQRIIVRNRNAVVCNCLRITVGTAKENELLITALKAI